MAFKHHSIITATTAFLFMAGSASLRAQNIYPVSGDALIHRLTIGTGSGSQTSNTAMGDSALFLNTSGVNNTAFGMRTLFQNTTGTDNAAFGYQTLRNSSSGDGNLALGSGALIGNQTGWTSNVALGQMALYNDIGANFSSTGTANTAVGSSALYSNTTGYQNTAFGYQSMYNSGSVPYQSTAFGYASLATSSTGVNNVALGTAADVATSSLSYTTTVGYGAVATSGNTVVIGNTSVTSIGGYAGWTTFSDGRYKKNIHSNVPGLAFINKLEPVTYTLDVVGIEARLHPNGIMNGPDGQPMSEPMGNPVMQQAMQEKSRIVHTGFIAQDVEKSAQSLAYNFSGVDKPKDDQQSFYGLRYSDFVVPLVKAVQELSAQNDSLQAINTRLAARLVRIKELLGVDSNAQALADLSHSPGRLFQNKPNPFGETTLINYYLPQNSGSASLQITDMNGEIIKTMALRGYGFGQVNIQTGQLAAGTYTYSLVVDGKPVDTRKMEISFR